MRITGGQIRGKTLAPPKNFKIRPSSGKVREAIFNIIGQDLSGVQALDLFAGTGLLGIEALSRGASGVVFVDQARQACSIIVKNLETAGYAHLGSICKWDLTKGLPESMPFNKLKYDLVFMDPPYGSLLIPGLMEDLKENNCLSPDAIVVVETAKRQDITNSGHFFSLVKTRVYGDTKITIFTTREL